MECSSNYISSSPGPFTKERFSEFHGSKSTFNDSVSTQRPRYERHVSSILNPINLLLNNDHVN